MVSERNNEHTLEILENETTDENQTEEIATGFSVVVDARMSAAMDEWFSRLQKTLENKFLLVLQSSAPSNKPHMLPRAIAGVACVGFSSSDSTSHPICPIIFFICGLYCSPHPDSLSLM